MLKLFMTVVVTAGALSVGVVASDRNGAMDAAQCATPCAHHDTTLDGVEILASFGGGWTMAEDAFLPVTRRAVVWFHRPVWVSGKVLMGKYIIEHDTDRQARGEPCTHLYADGDQTTPVAAFHCVHLEGEKAEQTIVRLQSLSNGLQQLVSFQFAGEDAAHGYPSH
jgi:hypothetical protein